MIYQREVLILKKRSTMFKYSKNKNIQRELGSFSCLLRDFLHYK